MTEYVISGKDAPSEDWFEDVVTHRGVKERTRDFKYLLIESTPIIIKQLKLKFPYLKIEEIWKDE